MFASLHRDFKMMSGAQSAVNAEGQSEAAVGHLLRAERGPRVLTTKPAKPMAHDSSDLGLSRRWVMQIAIGEDTGRLETAT